MPAAPLHAREAERVASLRSYRVLDTPADAALDAVAASAARALRVPVALVSLVDADRQWAKAAVGMDVPEIPRALSFCAHAVASGQLLVVPDATADARFADNTFVTGPAHLRFYAGAPLIGRDGLPLGALCVLDTVARRLEEPDLALLVQLAGSVSELLELRRVEASAGFAGRDMLRESHRLRRAVDALELQAYYQPVVDLPTGRWVGVEALVRWQHPQRGLLPPGVFLPLAEASGLVVPLGRLVLQQACRQVARWRASVPGAGAVHVAVNVSGRQLAEPGFDRVVAEALWDSGLPAQALTLELTETALADSSTAVDAALRAVRALGVRLALDDFGTGFASMGYLQRFHPDVIKLDRCFVTGLGRSARDDVLTSTIVELALRLGCDVIAEGVETPDQARALTQMGCRHAQGYLFSAPRPADELARLLPTSHA